MGEGSCALTLDDLDLQELLGEDLPPPEAAPQGDRRDNNSLPSSAQRIQRCSIPPPVLYQSTYLLCNADDGFAHICKVFVAVQVFPPPPCPLVCIGLEC